ncbi:MAG: DUF2948 family protein [Alphaproteobacteria bacterium]|nr:DUF2948 family protein [Alphaproteobacteria bacterium]
MNQLKLRAEDTEDIIILSAYLQDAITMMADIIYQPKARRFVIMLSRYVWEKCCLEKDQTVLASDICQIESCCRVRTGLHFDDVVKISSQNITTSLKHQPLELLSIEAHETADDMFHVDFVFSGQGVIRLECEIISAYMQDVGPPWATKCHPEHEISDSLQDETS